MPVIDLASPTQLLFEWGWLLVTRANGIVYLLLIVVFVLGMTVRLPRARRDMMAVRTQQRGNSVTRGGEPHEP